MHVPYVFVTELSFETLLAALKKGFDPLRKKIGLKNS